MTGAVGSGEVGPLAGAPGRGAVRAAGCGGEASAGRRCGRARRRHDGGRSGASAAKGEDGGGASGGEGGGARAWVLRGWKRLAWAPAGSARAERAAVVVGRRACHMARWDWRGEVEGMMWRPLIGGGEVAGGRTCPGGAWTRLTARGGRWLGLIREMIRNFREGHIFIGRGS